MYVRYGNYTHALNEAAVSFTKRPLMTEYGRQYGIHETWRIRGFIQADTQANLILAMNQMEAAYRVNNLTIALLGDDGGTVARFMTGVTPLGGTMVVGGVSFVDDGMTNAEGSTFRSYTIEVEGKYPTVSGPVTLAYTERLSFQGGGPRFVFLQPIVGLPQRQQTATATPYRVTQSGQAVGLYDWPTPPAPLWPFDEHRDQRVIDPGHPKRSGGGAQIVFTEFPISWTYQHESAVPMVGAPTPWGGL